MKDKSKEGVPEQGKERKTDYCSRCKATGVPLQRYCRTRDIVYHICRPCSKAKGKKYNDTTRGKEVAYKSFKKMEAAHPTEAIARRQLSYAVKIGNVVKPDTCSICGTKPKRIEGHHYDYKLPLNVIWCCSTCHADIHRALRESKEAV